MRCQWCGNRNPGGISACGVCGRDMTAEQTTDEAIRRMESMAVEDPEVTCPQCGALNSAMTRYCSLCATPLVNERPKSPWYESRDKPPPIRTLRRSLAALPLAMRLFISVSLIAFLSLPLYCALAYTVIPPSSPFSAMSDAPEPVAEAPAVTQPAAQPTPQPYPSADSQGRPLTVAIPVPVGAQQLRRKDTYSGAGTEATFLVRQPAEKVEAYYAAALSGRLKSLGWVRSPFSYNGRLDAQMEDYDDCSLVVEVEEDINQPESASVVYIDVRLGWRATIWFTQTQP